MKRLIGTLALTLLTACGGTTIALPGGAGPGASTVPRDFDPRGPATSTNDQSFVALLNDYRTSVGSGPLTYDARLNAAAQGHADDMLANDYFSHTDRKGGLVQDRIRAQGYEPENYAENLAKGQQSDAAVIRDWKNSPSHDRAMKADTLDEFGLGVAGSGGNTRWALVMAKEAK